MRQKTRKIVGWIVGGLLVLGILFAFSDKKDFSPAPAGNRFDIVSNYVKPSDCVIKGNISYKTGEKIYHLPSDAYYDRTTINEAYGERWFCSEAEARAAGWRHSYR